MTNAERLAIANDSLSLREPPYLKHFKDGRFHEWNGVALTGSHMPGPGFNFAAVPVAVTMAAFHAPPEFAEMMAPSLAYALDPDLALFVGNVNGEDVTAISYSRVGDTAVIAGTATLDEHRGKGYGAAGIRASL